MKDLIYLPLIALIAASISVTVTKSKMFAGTRAVIEKAGSKIKELINCPYCFGHWVVFILYAILPGKYIIQWFDNTQFSYTYWTLNFLFTSFATIAIMAMAHYVILRAYDTGKPVVPPSAGGNAPMQNLKNRFEELKRAAAVKEN